MEFDLIIMWVESFWFYWWEWWESYSVVRWSVELMGDDKNNEVDDQTFTDWCYSLGSPCFCQRNSITIKMAIDLLSDVEFSPLIYELMTSFMIRIDHILCIQYHEILWLDDPIFDSTVYWKSCLRKLSFSASMCIVTYSYL